MRQVWDREGLEAFAGFGRAEEAVRWSFEVLRRRRLPGQTPLWREAMGRGRSMQAAGQGLPDDWAGQLGLALKIQAGIAGLVPAQREVLALWALGDEKLLALRQARLGVDRMRYSFTYAELGRVLGCAPRTAWRRVQDALAAVEPELVRLGVVQAAVGGGKHGAKVQDSFKKIVRVNDFYGKAC